MNDFLKFTVLLLLMACALKKSLFAQNLVPNHSFENTGANPPGFPPWQNAGNGSADHFSTASGTVPANAMGYQFAQSGNAYAGAFIGRTGGGTAENITAPLLATMINNHRYYVSLHVSLADKCQHAIDRIGVLFSGNMISAPGGTNPHIAAPPSVVNSDFNYITDTSAWTKLEWVYTASGNERWINIGSFAPQGGNNFGRDTLVYPGSTWRSTYYYIDNVCVLDLDGPPESVKSKDTTICSFPSSIHAQKSGTAYLWSTGDTGASTAIKTPGTYWVKTMNECSFSIDSIKVILDIPVLTKKVTDTFLCVGTTMLLRTQSGASNIIWSTNATSDTIRINQTGNYWVKYELAGCKRHTDTFKVTSPDEPVLEISDTIVCNRDDVSVTTSTDYVSWLWSTGASSKEVSINNDGTYWVEVITQKGCKLSDTFTVSIIDTRQNFSDTIICKPVNFMLEAKGRPTAQYEWQDGSNLSYFHVTAPGFYSIKVSDGICFSEQQIVVTEEICDCNILVPNVFTPNGDGKNDYFSVVFPSDCEIKGYVLHIFNRWGQKVFESYDVNKKWDGYFNGEPADMGTYYYYLEFEKGTKSNSVKQKGDLLLIR